MSGLGNPGAVCPAGEKIVGEKHTDRVSEVIPFKQAVVGFFTGHCSGEDYRGVVACSGRSDFRVGALHTLGGCQDIRAVLVGVFDLLPRIGLLHDRGGFLFQRCQFQLLRKFCLGNSQQRGQSGHGRDKLPIGIDAAIFGRVGLNFKIEDITQRAGPHPQAGIGVGNLLEVKGLIGGRNGNALIGQLRLVKTSGNCGEQQAPGVKQRVLALRFSIFCGRIGKPSPETVKKGPVGGEPDFVVVLRIVNGGKRT